MPKDKEKFKKYQKDWRERNKDKVRRNNQEFIIKSKERDKTKHYFKLKDKKCKHCGNDAQVRHHLIPYKFDNFIFLCNDCHVKVHRELRK